MGEYHTFGNLKVADIPFNKIRKIDIVQLNGLTMGEWYARQTDKPTYMLNASLWDTKGAIGTIWKNGTLVRNEGNGFGFGVTNMGAFGFGDPWEIKWHNYITGYPALVINGNKTQLTVDSYVQNATTKRSAVAVAGQHIYLITGDGLTLNGFRNKLADFGVYHAINLDGGGSSRLMVDGKAVNNPTDNRKCPKAIAVWTTETVKEEKPMGKFKVAIDAGHGKHTSGKRCMKKLDANETREWVLNSRIATYVCEHLKASGIEALRMDDTTGATDVELATRTTTANNNDCDLYVSIHHDSGVDGGTGGGATCFIYPKASTKAKTLRDNVYAEFIKETGLSGNRSNPKTTADFYVLRKTTMPATLIECGFMDSATDVPIILTDSFARKAALGIARGICKTLGVTLKETTSESKPETEVETEHWAQKFYDSLVSKGMTINETRFNDKITRGEVFALLDQIVK